MKIAIVTGGTRGIGEAIARRLVQSNYFVYFTFNSNIQKAKSMEKELGSDRVRAMKCSAENPVEVNAVIDQIEHETEEINLLVNNAGITYDQYFALMDIEVFQKTVDVNLMGTVHFSRAVIHQMLSQKSGVIINIASLSGIIGMEGQTNYSAAKSGVIAFTLSLAKEVGKYNIRVISVAPGFIKTDMYRKMPEKIKKKRLEKIALKRAGKPEEVACLVEFLASENASYITGTVITIDGCVML